MTTSNELTTDTVKNEELKMHGSGTLAEHGLPEPIRKPRRTYLRIGALALPLSALSAWLCLYQPSTAHTSDSPVSREVRAQRYVVVDEGGNERAEFGVLPDGSARLIVWNKSKEFAASVGVDDFGMPHLAFGRPDRPPLVDIGILDKRSPVLIMRDARGKRRLGIVVTDVGTVSVGVYDKRGRNRCNLFMDNDGRPTLTLSDDKGTIRARLMIDTDGSSALDLFDRAARARVVLQVDADGEPGIAILNADGQGGWSPNISRK